MLRLLRNGGVGVNLDRWDAALRLLESLRNEIKTQDQRITELKAQLAERTGQAEHLNSQATRFNAECNLRAERQRELEAELAAARADAERLDCIVAWSNDGDGWLEDHVWDEMNDIFSEDEGIGPYEAFRALIDRERAKRDAAREKDGACQPSPYDLASVRRNAPSQRDGGKGGAK
jgi:DNA repair exonuclease SbcCD ATPase subunit